MHLHSYRIKNYRRLRDVHIELDPDISIFVGSNNSGKTSATQAIHAFVRASKERFSLYDFCSICWNEFDELGDLAADAELLHPLPAISLDLWFDVAAADLALVLLLLPSTDWQGTQVGIRIEYAARNDNELLETFRTMRKRVSLRPPLYPQEKTSSMCPGRNLLLTILRMNWLAHLNSDTTFLTGVISTITMCRFLTTRHCQLVMILVELQYSNRSLRWIASAAQRHLADPETGTSFSGGRSEDLSKRLSKFYKRNLDQRQEDHNALRAYLIPKSGSTITLRPCLRRRSINSRTWDIPGLTTPG